MHFYEDCRIVIHNFDDDLSAGTNLVERHSDMCRRLSNKIPSWLEEVGGPKSRRRDD